MIDLRSEETKLKHACKIAVQNLNNNSPLNIYFGILNKKKASPGIIINITVDNSSATSYTNPFLVMQELEKLNITINRETIQYLGPTKNFLETNKTIYQFIISDPTEIFDLAEKNTLKNKDEKSQNNLNYFFNKNFSALLPTNNRGYKHFDDNNNTSSEEENVHKKTF